MLLVGPGESGLTSAPVARSGRGQLARAERAAIDLAVTCLSLDTHCSSDTKGPPMNDLAPEKLDIHSEEFLRSLMRRQLRLSILCAATFLIALLGLPLA